jgi:hypothetical protein
MESGLLDRGRGMEVDGQGAWPHMKKGRRGNPAASVHVRSRYCVSSEIAGTGAYDQRS